MTYLLPFKGWIGETPWKRVGKHEWVIDEDVWREWGEAGYYEFGEVDERGRRPILGLTPLGREKLGK